MTLTEIKAYYESKTEQGTVDDAQFLIDANVADQEIQNELGQPTFAEGTPQTVSIGSGYLAGSALNASFAEIETITDNNGMVYKEKPFSLREVYKNFPYYYFIDYDNGNVYFTGSGSGTVTIYFTPTPTTFTALTDSPSYPTKFHLLLAYKMIINYFLGEDLDDINQTKVANSWGNRFQKMLDALIDWDARNKCRQAND